MNRREFVRRSSWTAGLALVPDWLVRGLGLDQDPVAPEKPTREAQLRAARRRAVGRGKPLLVFVVPEAMRQRRGRGYQFGALLNHGGRDVLLDLAVCEPACATVAEVCAELGPVNIAGDPMLLVAEPPREAHGLVALWQVKSIAPDFGIAPELQAGFSAAKKHRQASIALLADELHDAVARDRDMLAERADRERGTLAEDEHRALRELFADTDVPPPDELLVRAAAVVLMAAEAPRRRGDRARLLKYLLKASRRTFLEQRIPGSKWATSRGCGTVIEGEKHSGIVGPCGTGRVPPMGRRFLYLFTN